MQDASARARIRPPMGRATRRSPTEGGNEAALHWRGRGIIINIVVVVIFSAVIAERALASNERAIAAIGPRIQCGTHMRGLCDLQRISWPLGDQRIPLCALQASQSVAKHFYSLLTPWCALEQCNNARAKRVCIVFCDRVWRDQPRGKTKGGAAPEVFSRG